MKTVGLGEKIVKSKKLERTPQTSLSFFGLCCSLLGEVDCSLSHWSCCCCCCCLRACSIRRGRKSGALWDLLGLNRTPSCSCSLSEESGSCSSRPDAVGGGGGGDWEEGLSGRGRHVAGSATDDAAISALDWVFCSGCTGSSAAHSQIDSAHHVCQRVSL